MAIIFQDNFDSHADTCVCGGDVPAGWSQWNTSQTSGTYNTVTHYSGEVSSSGRGDSGKSLKLWRADTYFSQAASEDNYSGALVYEFPASPTYNHIFFRYYIKIPSSFDYTGEAGFKGWRFNTTAGGTEIYQNFRHTTAEAPFSMKTQGSWDILDNTAWTTVLDNTELQAIWDGNWHCIEWEFNLATDTINLWVNGTQKYTGSSFDLGGTFTYLQHFPMGNTYDHLGHWQASWQALEIDDLIISDEYVGPVSGGTSKRTLFRVSS